MDYGVGAVLKEACDGWVCTTVLEIDDDGSANGHVLDHLCDVCWCVDCMGMDGDVAEDAYLVFDIIGCIGLMDWVEEGLKLW